MKNNTNHTKLLHYIVYLVVVLSALTFNGYAQTMEKPIIISLSPLDEVIQPEQKSALIVDFKIPRGYWMGSNDPSSRNPSATIIKIAPQNNFIFEQPLYPKTKVAGVPVHKGYTYIFSGDIKVIIPYTANKDLQPGNYEIKIMVTYTPGLNAGQLITHVDEEYSTIVEVKNRTTKLESQIPSPSVSEVPQDFLVKEEKVNIPAPWNTLLYRWKEETLVPEILHWIWVDPENHGKHVQTAITPFIGSTENNGFTIGAGIALLNLTPEGIMTGLFQLRLYHNENVGSTAALELVSCPAAYFNYWLSAEISSDGKNKQFHFHNENLTIGNSDRIGYEIQIDIYKDPKARFYGMGAGSRNFDKTNYTHSEVGTTLDLYWMVADHLRIGVGGKYRSVAVNDGNTRLHTLMPFTTDQTGIGGKFSNVPGIKGATVVSERLNVVYDQRNSEFLPTDGFYGKVTGEFDQITDQVITSPEIITQYGRFIGDFRQYFSTVDQKFTFLMRNTWTITTSQYIPFFEQATIGGDYSDRGFDAGRFYGQNSVFASMELRYQAIHMDLIGTPWTVELAPFLDAATIFNSDGFNGRVNINPGISMRMLNKPNVGMVGNIAWGQDGIILTGGVQLPF